MANPSDANFRAGIKYVPKHSSGPGKVGRPRKAKQNLTKYALWKRAYRKDHLTGVDRHHVDNNYGRKSEKVEILSRSEHNKKRKKK